MQEMQVRSLSQEDALEKERATHSIILAWKSLWLEEPGGLQSVLQHVFSCVYFVFIILDLVCKMSYALLYFYPIVCSLIKYPKCFVE